MKAIQKFKISFILSTYKIKLSKMRVDLGKQLVVPQEKATINLPDLVFWSETQRVVNFVELRLKKHTGADTAASSSERLCITYNVNW